MNSLLRLQEFGFESEVALVPLLVFFLDLHITSVGLDCAEELSELLVFGQGFWQRSLLRVGHQRAPVMQKEDIADLTGVIPLQHGFDFDEVFE